MRFAVLCLAIVHAGLAQVIAPPPKGWLGDDLGELNGAKVYIVNDTTIQIDGFVSGGADNIFFSARANAEQKLIAEELFFLNQENGFLNKVPTTGIPALDGQRVIVNTPGGAALAELSKVGLAKGDKELASAAIAADIDPPKKVVLLGSITPPTALPLIASANGQGYSVGAAQIEVLDRKSILLRQFTFLGTNPPDGYIYVGQALPDAANQISVDKTNGVKAYVRGYDTGAPTPLSLRKDFIGEDIIVDMPGESEIYDINFLSVYCYLVGVDFGHVDLRLNLNPLHRLPPHIPAVVGEATVLTPWEESTITDTDTFEFWLGPSGARRGYQALRGAKPDRWVWWVNQQLAPRIIVQRGKTYTFKVFGGADWKVYLTNDGTGGHLKKPANEKALEKKFKEQESDATALCYIGRLDKNEDEDKFNTFEEWKTRLFEKCSPETGGQPATFTWTPDENTPDELFYGTIDVYNMGWKIEVQ